MRCKRGPENDRAVAAHVSRLLAHYWATNENPALRSALAQDWIEDLAEFHEQVVADACREWRRAQTRRPLPADIRKLCVAECEMENLYKPSRHPDALPDYTTREVPVDQRPTPEHAAQIVAETRAVLASVDPPKPKLVSSNTSWQNAKMTPERLAELMGWLSGNCPPPDNAERDVVRDVVRDVDQERGRGKELNGEMGAQRPAGRRKTKKHPAEPYGL